MKKTFFARYALLVLMIVFFWVPFALRGSRYAIQRMKNDVKDWLPDDFKETAELDWFRQRFLGEQFVVVSWDDCHGTLDDERFQTFVDKLFPELAPSERNEGLPLPRRQDFVDEQLGMYTRQMIPTDGDGADSEPFIGNRLGLHSAASDHKNWGGLDEKWLKADHNRWVYLTPSGDLYAWDANTAWPAALWRAAKRFVTGRNTLSGELVKALGPEDGPWYYADPRRLTARLFKSVTTGPGMLSEMTRADGALRIDEQEARRRLDGVLFGPDGEQTCIIVTLTEYGKHDIGGVVRRGMLGKTRGRLLDVAEQSGIYPGPKPSMVPAFLAGIIGPLDRPAAAHTLRLGGPPVDNVAIDEEGQITLVRLIGLSLLVGLGLAWLCFRSISVTLMVFLVGGISAVASMSLVYWTGSSVDAVLMSMPPLVYVLGLSGAVHIVNYYRETAGEQGLRGAPERALKLGWRPCTLAAITTGLGLMSLYVSNILPIRKFGIYSALGVMATLVLLFSFLPSALQLWPPRRLIRKRAGTGMEILFERFWNVFGRWIVRHYRLVTAGCLLTLALVGAGLLRINTSIQLLKLFDADAKIIEDYRWLEANLGKLVPMEVVIRVDPSLLRSTDDRDDPHASLDARLQFSFLERMEIAEYARREIEHVFGPPGQDLCGRPMVASTFAPPLPSPGHGFRTTALRGGINGRLEANRDRFLASDYLRIDPQDQAELWRISLRLAALSDIDFGTFVTDLKAVLEPMLSAYRYREVILRELAARRPDQQFRGASVYLAGLSFEEPPSPSARPTDQPPLDQTAVFVRALQRVLTTAGVTVRALPESYQAGAVPAEDCIVVVGSAPTNLDQGSDSSRPLVIDARDHRFDPSAHEVTTALEEQAHVAAVYTGLVPVVYKAQRTLLTSLVESTGWAFCMIAVVMMLVLRSVRAGFLSMLPNIFPVVVIFGTMGWTNVMVDIGTMMTASVAMGIAVDDTIHFLTWFRRGLDQGQSRQRAILLAYQRVGTAMVQTTVIGGLGLSIFALSTFTPTQRFGTLMLALLMAALVGDLVFLPALLASPLGRIFRTRQAIPDSSPSQFTPHIPVTARPGASPTQSLQSRSENDAAFRRVRPDIALGT